MSYRELSKIFCRDIVYLILEFVKKDSVEYSENRMYFTNVIDDITRFHYYCINNEYSPNFIYCFQCKRCLRCRKKINYTKYIKMFHCYECS